MPDDNHSDDNFLELRGRLLIALEVLEQIAPPSFEAAFDLLATHVPGIPTDRDDELAARFRKVVHAIEQSKDRKRHERVLSREVCSA